MKLEAFDKTYLGMAAMFAKHSKAQRKQVGAILVTQTGILLPGFNGTPHGWDNQCETDDWVTKPETIHAETNCVLKAARQGVSVLGSTIYITLSPCPSCAALIAQAGIKRVVYAEEYRDKSGVNLLLTNGISVIQFTP